MDEKKIYVLFLCITGSAFLYYLYRLDQKPLPGEDFPDRDEILRAIENGAANLTVTPLTQSDN